MHKPVGHSCFLILDPRFRGDDSERKNVLKKFVISAQAGIHTAHVIGYRIQFQLCG